MYNKSQHSFLINSLRANVTELRRVRELHFWESMGLIKVLIPSIKCASARLAHRMEHQEPYTGMNISSLRRISDA